jgi:RecB family endonuclease NucS
LTLTSFLLSAFVEATQHVPFVNLIVLALAFLMWWMWLREARKRLGVWARSSTNATATAIDVKPSGETAQEAQLEKAIVTNFATLFPDFTLVGEQVVTDTGPLDILAKGQGGALVCGHRVEKGHRP